MTCSEEFHVLKIIDIPFDRLAEKLIESIYVNVYYFLVLQTLGKPLKTGNPSDRNVIILLGKI